MNILYLINHAGKAGTEKYVKNLIDAYHNKKAACFFCYNEEGELSQSLKEKGIPLFQVKMTSPLDLKAAYKIARICKKHHIDFIHTQYPRENFIAILSKLFWPKTKVIYTCHLTLKNNFIWRVLNRIFTPFNKKIIAVCNNAKELLIENGVKADKITVIFNGIRPSEKIKSNEFKKELNINDDTVLISILARFYFSKGLDFLIDSIKLVKNESKIPFVLAIAGDGEDFEKIKSRVENEGLEDCVKLLGYIKDSDKLLASTDIYLNSSKCYEALSFAVLEAMSHKIPVVLTDVGGNPDIVRGEEDGGYLVPYGDADLYKDKILKLINDPKLRQRLGENAYNNVRAKFNLDKILEDTFRTCYEE